MITEVVLEHVLHAGKKRIFLKFKYNSEVISFVKTKFNALWSNTHKGWYVNYTQEAENRIKVLFEIKEITLIVKNASNPLVIPLKNNPANPAGDLSHLPEDTLIKLTNFKSWLLSKRYSNSTISTYTNALKTFLRYYAFKPVSEITNEDLINFNTGYILTNRFSASFQNQVVNAIKLFFKTIELKVMTVETIHRPNRAKILPNVLSKEEIKLILNAHGNIKHKAMLSLIYSCGLRCGELINLKILDIDSKRGLIMIRQAKGKKDRVVPLSHKILILLRNYFIAYKPKQWLFEGQNKNEAYNESSLSVVLKQAVEKTGIQKPVTLHWLRHSYATHLLENGTDLRYIQEILGHSRSTTTEIYTHVSNKSIQKVVSPFDSL